MVSSSLGSRDTHSYRDCNPRFILHLLLVVSTCTFGARMLQFCCTLDFSNTSRPVCTLLSLGPRLSLRTDWAPFTLQVIVICGHCEIQSTWTDEKPIRHHPHSSSTEVRRNWFLRVRRGGRRRRRRRRPVVAIAKSP